jgi:flagellar hook protein FlgE
MGSAYLTALSGLSANGSAIDITSNNLANLNTVGFKTQSADFDDMLASEMDVPGQTTALGVSQPDAIMQFQQGGLATSQGPLDAAISGDGFFVTSGPSGAVYTRAGDFQAGQDAAGNTALLSQTGNPVEGYRIGANGQVSTSLSEILLPGTNPSGSAVTGYSIGDGGVVVASCADGSTFNVAQLAVAQIQNPQTMTALGSGDFKVTPNTMGYGALNGTSGALPYVGTASAIGTQIVGGALEQSNTDMATELTNLMVYQRAYEANSRALTTNDEMQEALYDLVA